MLVAFVPLTARAQSAPPEHPKQHESWYGGQVILADVASVALALGGTGISISNHDDTFGSALGVGGIFGYMLGGPTVHFAHGRVGAGIASFALRLGMPMVLAFDGLLIGTPFVREDANGQASDEAEIGAGVGLVGGMLGAMAIDAALIARENVVDEKPAIAIDAKYTLKPAEARSPALIDWSPTAIPVRGGATVGIAGVF